MRRIVLLLSVRMHGGRGGGGGKTSPNEMERRNESITNESSSYNMYKKREVTETSLLSEIEQPESRGASSVQHSHVGRAIALITYADCPLWPT